MLSKEPGYGLFSEDIHYRIATQGRKGHRKTFVNQGKKKKHTKNQSSQKNKLYTFSLLYSLYFNELDDSTIR